MDVWFFLTTFGPRCSAGAITPAQAASQGFGLRQLAVAAVVGQLLARCA